MTAPDDMWNWIYPAIQELKNTVDQPWDERRASFLEQLGIHAADDHAVTGELLRQLDELPDDERSELMASEQLDSLAYGLVQAQGTESEQPATSGEEYDEAAWQTYLTTNGSHWDGTADSWPAFREWFVYHAGDQGLSTPANALLDYLESMSVAERSTALGQYGVTIAAGETTPEEGNLDKMLDELAAMTEDIPGIEELSDEEIARIISETIEQTGK